MKIQYTSSIPSAGKTHDFITDIVADNGVSVYAAPTIDLINETYKNLKSSQQTKYNSYEVVKITSENNSGGGSVYGKFTEKLAESVSLGKKAVILTTHKTLINAAIPKQVDAKLYIDETLPMIPSIDWIYGSFSDHQAMFGEINIGIEQVNSSILRLVTNESPDLAKSKDLLENLKKRSSDRTTFNKTGDHEILQNIVNTETDSYYIRSGKKGHNPKSQIVHFNSVSFLNKFSALRIASAYFEITILYHYLKMLGHKLIKYKGNIDPSRVARIKSNYKRINLFPLVDSIRGRSKEGNKTSIIIKGDYSDLSLDQDAFFEFYHESIAQIESKHGIKDDALVEVLYDYISQNPSNISSLGKLKTGYFKAGNKTVFSIDTCFLKYGRSKLKPTFNNPTLLVYNDIRDRYGNILDGSSTLQKQKFESLGFYNTHDHKPEDFKKRKHRNEKDKDNYLRCSSSSFGLNHFSDFNNMIFMSSLNYPPQVAGILKQMLPDYPTDNGLVFESMAQTINRLSIRDPESKKPVNIILPSTGIANILKKHAFSNRCIVHKPPNLSLQKILIDSEVNNKKREVQAKKRLEKHESLWKEKVPTIKWLNLIPALKKQWNSFRHNYKRSINNCNTDKTIRYERQLCQFIIKHQAHLKFRSVDVRNAKKMLKTLGK